MITGEAETTFVNVGPTRVRVRVTGEGPPLLLIMGIGGNLDMWDPLVARLPGRQLVMFDFPGTGGSGASWMPPTMPADALFTRMLVRKLGYGRMDVLGYSWGGLLAQALAIQHASTVRRLVLAGTTFGLGGLPPGPLVAARMLTPRRYYSARISPRSPHPSTAAAFVGTPAWSARRSVGASAGRRARGATPPS